MSFSHTHIVDNILKLRTKCHQNKFHRRIYIPAPIFCEYYAINFNDLYIQDDDSSEWSISIITNSWYV